MTTVVIVNEAEEQLRGIVEWWTANRPAVPALALDEFERCVMLLENSPDVGLGFHRTAVPGVRRLVMKKTKHCLYYVHDVDNAVVYVIAVWGAPKEGDPVLRDPR
ncbi:MAG: type II toxin-antitoxin system RelE/ParE family toxin [Deltaproteobacteria bacterium]|nr:type II toxin-antitoxin system RelE/ParE family toxin [Deltaproteobacteria bacterium]